MSIKTQTIPQEVQEVIDDLKKKGVKFIKCSEEEAIQYLQVRDNSELIPLYVSNFDKDDSDTTSNELIDVDFAYLIDLYEIDDEVKTVVFRMINQIERFLRARVKQTFNQLDESFGIKISNEFLSLDYDGEQENDTSDTSEEPKRRIHQNIISRKNDKNVKVILSKYNVDLTKKIQDIPPRDLIKLLTFGDVIKFFHYYSYNYGLDDYRLTFPLNDVRNLRNDLFHVQPILVGLDEMESNYKLRGLVIPFLTELGFSKYRIWSKLRNPKTRQLVNVIYSFNELVKDDNLKQFINQIINDLFETRMFQHPEYYVNNYLLTSTYYFFLEIIKKIFWQFSKN